MRTPRPRLTALLALLAVAVVDGATLLIWPVHPRTVTPAAVPQPPPGEDLIAEEARAKALPEYAELKGPVGSQTRFTDEQVTRLIHLAGHPNAWIRVLAVTRLAYVTGPRRDEAIGRAVASLKDPNRHVRLAAMDAIARSGARECVPDLLPFRESADPDEREAASRAIQRLGA